MARADFTRIASNIAALQALNSLKNINTKLGVAQLRLATGRRINSAADDAAGMTIATKLDYKVRGLGQVLSNIADAQNLIAVAEGHLTNISDILAVMKTKAEQAANDTLGVEGREAVLAELQELNTQIDNEVAQAQWGKTQLLDVGSLNFQIGAGTSTSDELKFDMLSGADASGFTSDDLGVSAGTAAAVGNWVVESGDAAYTTEVVALTDTVGNATLGELGAGSYQLYVPREGSGTRATVTVQLKDVSTGEWVTIGAGAGATSIVTQGVGAGGTTIDLGTGLSFEVGGVATASGATGVEAAEYSFVYAESGNKVGSQDASQVFMDLIDTASSQVSKALGYIGATVNRMSYQETSLSVAKVNTEASYNRIMNADMAFEQVEATKWAILQQTAVAMLAQANMAPQSILGLFR
ncbi:MAG: hypothetical protein E3J25_07165 [Anaerolineales bacterium]|nr:MAG: hypothetical protein E3J25_07165 [Anaerolineales bacterium]